MVQRERSIIKDIDRVFSLQQDHRLALASTTVRERRHKLTRLLKAVLEGRDAFKEAMGKDFTKNPVEVDLSEVYVLVHEIRHTRRNLARWMRPQRVDTPLVLMGARSTVKYESKGLSLIIAPWNYPLLLALGPVVSAIAAGNSVILKPSEYTPATSAVVAELIRSTFDEREVAVFEGGPEVGQHLLDKPFNHIFFTGSTRVGKIVMEAAAKNLASVTLELGGKSPVIIDETVNIKNAAQKVVWGKFLNGGQTCIAPDYVWIHEKKRDAFVSAFKKTVQQLYGEKVRTSDSYARIINQDHAQRLADYIEEVRSGGGKVLLGGEVDVEERYIAPTLLADIPDDAQVMQEEIFGPVLPVLTFKDLEEPIRYINEHPNPLSIYIFSNKRPHVERIIARTRAGGTVINNTLVHFFNPNLPFGGFNQSGLGNAHGFYGFREFSNARAVLHQYNPGFLSFVMPPYNQLKAWIADLAIRWL